jgi:peptide/nickel transport system permease protein
VQPGRFLVRRIVQIPLVLFFVTIIIFALMHVTAGDPISIMLGAYSTPEAVAALKKEYALDRPLVEQYLHWLGRMARGDMGVSIRTNEHVSDIILTRLPVSIGLATAATLLALVVAIPAGLLAAYRQKTAWDYGLMAFTMLGLSVPNFTLALLLILVFAMKLDWLPISGVRLSGPDTEGGLALLPFILPTIALAVPRIAELSRFVRASMLDVLQQDYIRTAYAKGLAPFGVVLTHALKNAMIPVITVTAITFAYLVGTTITIEYIFAIPGIGSALVNAVVNRDFPVIQGLTLANAVLFLLMNLLADYLYAVVDPRVAYE